MPSLARTLTVLAALSAPLVASPAAGAVKPNDTEPFLNVWNANVENLAYDTRKGACDGKSGNWRNLVQEMKARALAPDLITVQQINRTPTRFKGQVVDNQVRLLIKEMNKVLRANYKLALITDSRAQKRGCHERWKQSNAIIYRDGRFDVPADANPQQWPSFRLTSKGCVVDSPRSTRTVNGAITLTDQRQGGKRVRVGVIHWPEAGANKGGDRRCNAERNAPNAVAAVNEPTASLQIIAGDSNQHAGDAGAWLGPLTGAGGFADAGAAAGAQTLRSKPTRIDFLFARRSSGLPAAVSAVETPGAPGQKKPGIGDYSDHYAVKARVGY